MIWKMEWKQKTLAFFLSDPEFCRRKIFPAAHISGEILRRRGGFFLTADSVRFYSVRGAFVCCVHADPGTGNRDGSGNVCAGVRSLWRTWQEQRLLLPQYLIYVPVYFWLAGTCVSGSLLESGKIMDLFPSKTGSSLPEAGDHCFWGIYRGDNGRMFSESLVG